MTTHSLKGKDDNRFLKVCGNSNQNSSQNEGVHSFSRSFIHQIIFDAVEGLFILRHRQSLQPFKLPLQIEDPIPIIQNLPAFPALCLVRKDLPFPGMTLEDAADLSSTPESISWRIATSHNAKECRLLGREESASIFQLEVAAQIDKTSCGYHSFHAAVQLIQSLVFGSREVPIDQLKSRTLFNLRHRHYIALLLDHVRSFPSRELDYLWDEWEIESGVMERPFAEFLIENDPEIQRLGGSHTFSSFADYSRTTLGSGFISMEELIIKQQRIDLFSNSSNDIHVFLFGSFIHWSTVIAIKRQTHLTLIYLDSENTPTVGRDDQWLESWAEYRMRTSDTQFLFFDNELMRFRRSLKERRFFIHLILRLIRGETDLITESCLHHFQEMTVLFHEFFIGLEISELFSGRIPQSLTDQHYREILEKLNEFFAEKLHPVQLRETLDRVFLLFDCDRHFHLPSVKQLIDMGHLVQTLASRSSSETLKKDFPFIYKTLELLRSSESWDKLKKLIQ